MHDAFVMRGGERIGERGPYGENSLEREAALWDACGKRFALDELHREEGDTVALLDGIDRDDVRMVERGNGSGFPLESGKTFRIARHRWSEHLQGDCATELRVERAIHLTHAAGTDG